MEAVQEIESSGILNETTMTLHRQQGGMTDFQTPCGHTYHVPQERLRIVEIQRVKADATKCGQCFEEGGGY